MKNKTFKKRKMNTCYIAPHKHNHAKKKSSQPTPLIEVSVLVLFLLTTLVTLLAFDTW